MTTRKKIRPLLGSLAFPNTAYAITVADPSLSPGAGSFSVHLALHDADLVLNTHYLAIFGTPSTTGWAINQYGQYLYVYLKNTTPLQVGVQSTVFNNSTNWIDFYFVFDASTHTIFVYREDVLVAQSTPNAWSGSFSASDTFRLGGNASSGTMSDVHYSATTAWSAADVAAHVKSSKALPGVTHSWPMNDGAGTTARATLGGLAMTLNNGAFFASDCPPWGLPHGIVRNHVAQSEAMASASYTLGNATDGGAYIGQLPTGVGAMRLIAGTAANGAHYSAQTPTTIPNGSRVVGSMYIAAGTGAGTQYASVSSDGGVTRTVINCATGAVTAGGGYSEPTNVAGVWRVTTQVTTAPAQIVGFIETNAAGGVAFVGTGESRAFGGAMLEIAVPGQTTASLYVPTQATPLSVYGGREMRQNLLVNASRPSQWTMMTAGNVGSDNTADVPPPLPGMAVGKIVYDGSNTAGNYRFAVQSGVGGSLVMSPTKSYAVGIWLRVSVGPRNVLVNLNGFGGAVGANDGGAPATLTTSWQFVRAYVAAGQENGTAGLYLDLRDGGGVNSAVTYYVAGAIACEGTTVGEFIDTTTAPANANGAPRKAAA